MGDFKYKEKNGTVAVAIADATAVVAVADGDTIKSKKCGDRKSALGWQIQSGQKVLCQPELFNKNLITSWRESYFSLMNLTT